MTESVKIKQKAMSGFFWSMTENSGSYFLHFLIGLVLIRLIEPVNYGLIGMMTFFTTFPTTLVDFGFSSALIQKQDIKDEHYSTTLWVNIFVGFVSYISVYFLSGYVADFYNEPVLKLAIRVMSLNFVISAFGIVHTTHISKTLNYKLWTRINLTSLVIAGSTAITIAYYGYGLWALIFIHLTQNFLNTVQLWLLCEYKRGFKFSKTAFMEMFIFSRPILLISVVNSIYNELYNIIIGKFFRSERLAYYLRAKQTSEIFALQFSQTLNKVMFPVLSNFQDDEPNLKLVYHKILIMTGFINFCVLSFLAANGEAFFVLLFTDKWLSAVPYFQFLCIEGMFLPLHSIAGYLLIAKGESKKFMKIEFSKRIVQTIIILVSFHSIETIIAGQIVLSVIYLIIGFNIVKQQINESVSQQIKTLLPYLLLSSTIFGINYFFIQIMSNQSYIVQILLNLVISLISYITISEIFKLEAYLYIKDIAFLKFREKFTTFKDKRY